VTRTSLIRPLLRWHNLVHLAAGVWLGFSPWLLGFFDDAPAATWNALATGATVIVLAVVDLDSPAAWELWLLALVGGWVALSPLLLGFGTLLLPTAACVLTGAAVLGLACAALLARPGATRAHPAAHDGGGRNDPVRR
jgi:hypothetical protein